MTGAASILAAGACAGLCLGANPRFVIAMPALGLLALVATRGSKATALRRASLAGALGLAGAALVACFAILGCIEGGGAGPGALIALGRHDSQYLLLPSRLDEYPVMMVVFEGPLLSAFVVHGVWLALHRSGVVRVIAGAGPLVTLALLTVGYGHHQLRYVSMLLPWLALAAGLSLDSAMERLGRPAALSLALIVVAVLPFTRAPMPRGLPAAYARALDVLERSAGPMVLASNFPVLQVLSDCRTGRITFLPPLRVAAALDAVSRAGVTHCVLDFERYFLGRFERGELSPEVSRDALLRRAQPLSLPNPVAEGPYLWFEHGVTRPPPDRGGFDAVEIHSLAAAAGR